MAVAFLVMACEGTMGPQGIPGRDGEVSKLVVDNITVGPEDWHEAQTGDGLFDYFYADVHIPGFTWEMLDEGFYYTYWKYNDSNILVQEGLGVSMHLERYDDVRREWYAYTETVGCSYSEENIRFRLSRSDFYDALPTATLVFRFVVMY